MNSLYYKLLGLFIIFIITINTLTFLIGLNTKQLTNLFFYDQRVVALLYFTKNIIIETGINLKNYSKDELQNIANKAAEKYNIDIILLNTMMNIDNTYNIQLNGGMGITSIPPIYFNKTEYHDPYKPYDNIYATASIIKKLKDNGISYKDIPKYIYFGNVSEYSIKIMSYETYLNTINIVNKYNLLAKSNVQS